MTELRRSLSTVLEQNAIQIELRDAGNGIRVATLADPELRDTAGFVLAVRADMPADSLRARFPAQAKLGPVERIRDLVQLQLPGITMRQLPVAPRQIPYHAGHTYFEIDKGSDQEAAGTLRRSAFHFAGEFPSLDGVLGAVRAGRRDEFLLRIDLPGAGGFVPPNPGGMHPRGRGRPDRDAAAPRALGRERHEPARRRGESVAQPGAADPLDRPSPESRAAARASGRRDPAVRGAGAGGRRAVGSDHRRALLPVHGARRGGRADAVGRQRVVVAQPARVVPQRDVGRREILPPARTPVAAATPASRPARAAAVSRSASRAAIACSTTATRSSTRCATSSR